MREQRKTPPLTAAAAGRRPLVRSGAKGASAPRTDAGKEMAVNFVGRAPCFGSRKATTVAFDPAPATPEEGTRPAMFLCYYSAPARCGFGGARGDEGEERELVGMVGSTYKARKQGRERHVRCSLSLSRLGSREQQFLFIFLEREWGADDFLDTKKEGSRPPAPHVSLRRFLILSPKRKDNYLKDYCA
jgi:hypothetical protein